ncbi:MAG: tRNA-binding protein [Planctomycetota bacterium]
MTAASSPQTPHGASRDPARPVAVSSETVSVEAFAALDLRIGTVRSAEPNPKARKPAYVLRIDFGPRGVLTSSAQITDRYAPAELVGRQVVAVVNLPPKRVAGVKSEALLLGAVEETGVTLLRPDAATPNGTSVA